MAEEWGKKMKRKIKKQRKIKTLTGGPIMEYSVYGFSLKALICARDC
jgi:hypothetical protein